MHWIILINTKKSAIPYVSLLKATTAKEHIKLLRLSTMLDLYHFMPCFDCVGIKPVNPILCAVLKRCKADESLLKIFPTWRSSRYLHRSYRPPACKGTLGYIPSPNLSDLLVSLSLVLSSLRTCNNKDTDIAIIWPQISQCICISTIFIVNKKPRLHNACTHKLDHPT